VLYSGDFVAGRRDTDVEHDCGEIPVVDNMQSKRPVGVVTDRDITIRTVALGKNPLDLRARDCMSSPAVTVTPETSVEDCCNLMEENQLRRFPSWTRRDAAAGSCRRPTSPGMPRRARRASS
jgi:predicted transcriptional regulator